MTRRMGAAAAILTLLATGSAAAIVPSPLTKHRTRTFRLVARRISAFEVRFPTSPGNVDTTYTGKATVLGPAPGATGPRPNLHKVKIVEAGPTFGGVYYGVRAINDNRPGTAPVRIRISVTTVEHVPPAPGKPCRTACT